MAIRSKNKDLQRWYECYLINHGVKKGDATVDWIISELRDLWDKNQILAKLTRDLPRGGMWDRELVEIHEAYAYRMHPMEEELKRLREFYAAHNAE